MGHLGKVDKIPLNPQVSLEPFEKWAIDFVGPFNPPSQQKVHILVYMDYVTKWVEAKEVVKETEKAVSNFMFEEIFSRYGAPREIVSDGGAQFTSHMIVGLMKKYGIKHRITSPYHPQENGQVESTNKVLENILTKTVASHRRDWVEKLPEALWAYRTTWRNTMGFSPYEIVYGKYPLFPIELKLKHLEQPWK
jgi:IS30 family transposase